MAVPAIHFVIPATCTWLGTRRGNNVPRAWRRSGNGGYGKYGRCSLVYGVVLETVSGASVSKRGFEKIMASGLEVKSAPRLE